MIETFWISARVGLLATIFGLALAIFASYLVSQRTFRGKRALEVVFMLPLVLPPTVVGLYVLLLLGNRGLEGWTGWAVLFTAKANVLAATIAAFPLMYQALKAGFQHVDRGLLEAGRTLGASEGQLLVYVTLPLLLPSLAAASVLGFARAIGEFGITMMIAGNIPGETQTLATAIYAATVEGDLDRALTMSVGLLALAIVVVWMSTRWGVTER